MAVSLCDMVLESKFLKWPVKEIRIYIGEILINLESKLLCEGILNIGC
jgi:hypothetical protein